LTLRFLRAYTIFVDRKGVFRIVVYALVISCCVFTATNIVKRARPPESRAIVIDEEYYNKKIPYLTFFSIDNQKIELAQFRQKVIIAKFTNFFENDINYLIYLDYLAQRYRNKIALFFFYNSSHDSEAGYINRYANFFAPIIKANEGIREAFNARGNETIIIGDDFRLKYKNSANSKRLLFLQASKYAHLENSPIVLPKGGFAYLDLDTKERKPVFSVDQTKDIIVNICISPCAECSDAERNTVLKEVLGDHPANLEMYFLFGGNNSSYLIEEYKEKYQLFDARIHFGLLPSSGNKLEDKYFEMFNYEHDPFLLVIRGNNNIIFTEDAGNSKDIDLKFLTKLLQ